MRRNAATIILLLITVASSAMAGGSLSFGTQVSKVMLSSNIQTALLDLTFDNVEGLSALQFRIVANRNDMVLRGAVRGAAIADAQRWACASNIIHGPIEDTLIVLFWSRTLTPLHAGTYPGLILVSYEITADVIAREMRMVLSDITSALGDGRGTAGTISVGEIPTAVIQTELPSTFALDQNFPNPFNPTTTIRYSVPAVSGSSSAGSGIEMSVSSSVRLVVYDMLGQEVAVLVNETQTAGNHETNFKPGDLASGTYLYRLEINGNVRTRTMLLLK
jgi:hypothetical protein